MTKDSEQPEYTNPWTSGAGREILDPGLSPLDWSSDTRHNVSGTLEVFSIGVRSGLFPRIKVKSDTDHMNSEDSDEPTVHLEQISEDPHKALVLAVYTIISTHINSIEE